MAKSKVDRSKEEFSSGDTIRYLEKRYYQDEQTHVHCKISANLLKLRWLAKLSQKKLAEMASTNPSTIGRLESSNYQGHSLSMIIRVAGALGYRIEVKFIKIEGESNGADGEGKRTSEPRRTD